MGRDGKGIGRDGWKGGGGEIKPGLKKPDWIEEKNRKEKKEWTGGKRKKLERPGEMEMDVSNLFFACIVLHRGLSVMYNLICT